MVIHTDIYFGASRAMENIIKDKFWGLKWVTSIFIVKIYGNISIKMHVLHVPLKYGTLCNSISLHVHTFFFQKYHICSQMFNTVSLNTYQGTRQIRTKLCHKKSNCILFSAQLCEENTNLCHTIPMRPCAPLRRLAKHSPNEFCSVSELQKLPDYSIYFMMIDRTQKKSSVAFSSDSMQPKVTESSNFLYKYFLERSTESSDAYWALTYFPVN